VKHRSVVLLHDEAASIPFCDFPLRLRRAPEIPHAPIGFKPHRFTPEGIDSLIHRFNKEMIQ
jgi:hypothetical protein